MSMKSPASDTKGAESWKCATLESALVQLKTSVRSVNLTIANSTPVGRKIEGSKCNVPFAHNQDQLKTMSDLFNSTTSKSNTDFSAESQPTLRK